MAGYHHTDRSARRPSSRPRSLYGAGTSSGFLSALGSTSSPHLNSSYSSSPYSSPYSSPTSFSTYGGTSSGYGGLMLPTSSYNLSSSPKSSSSPTSSYLTNLLQSAKHLGSNRTGSPTYSTAPSTSSAYNHRPSAGRSNSFNRHNPSSFSSLNSGSRSLSALSLKSDISEGYASGGDKSGRSSRLSSSSSDREATANGEIDYKKLYEESQVENERLRELLKKSEEDLKECRLHSDKNASPSKNSMSEMEKRERRAMERKLSEMEEELKQLQKLKAENERLRAENRALTRVVSKLTASANAGK